MQNKSVPLNFEEYIVSFPDEVRKLLIQMREIIQTSAPEAEEIISYQMPAYKYKGILVYFAGYKNHIGFYPTSSGIENFKTELSAYKMSKGSVQFPINQPLPEKLIRDIVIFRLKENIEKTDLKVKKSPSIK